MSGFVIFKFTCGVKSGLHLVSPNLIQGASWTVNKHDETTIYYFIDGENIDV